MSDLQAFLKSLSREGFTPRQRLLMARRSYYEGTQFDHLRFDFDGRQWPSNDNYSTPAPKASEYIPIRSRRPDAPNRLPKRTVNSFTQLLFGHGSEPGIASDNEEFEEFLRWAIRKSRLFRKFIKARKYGGSCGVSAVVPSAIEGKLRIDVLDPVYVHVHEWRDKEELVPATVIYQYTFDNVEYRPDGTKDVKRYWYRKIWTETAVQRWIAEYRKNEDPNWILEEELEHGLSRCPVVYMVNDPDTEEDDFGEADYDDRLRELSDTIDYLQSLANRSFRYASEPKMVVSGVKADQVKEVLGGSQYGLVLPDPNSKAGFLEAGFVQLQTVQQWIADFRLEWQNTTQCVTLDPEKTIGQAQSGEAMRKLMAQMHGRADTFRESYGQGIEQCLGLFAEMQRVSPDAVRYGKGISETEFSLVWPPYIKPSPEELEQQTRTALAAKGQLISSKTAVKYTSQGFGVKDIDSELDEIQSEQKAALDDFQGRMIE